MTTKLESFAHGEWRPVQYPGTFSLERTSGPDRLRIAPRGEHAAIVLSLASELRPEFKVLYVLHSPRGESGPGRYESPAIDATSLTQFVRRFAAFLEGDGRHDVWVHSREENATIVWDRHDLIYAYGPLQSFSSALAREGLQPGAPTHVPDPHAHRYHPEWDASERDIVAWFDWQITPLRDEDEL